MTQFENINSNIAAPVTAVLTTSGAATVWYFFAVSLTLYQVQGIHLNVALVLVKMVLADQSVEPTHCIKKKE